MNEDTNLAQVDVSKDLTLDEFMALLRQDVDRFEREYKDGINNQPSIFPATMGVADWAEQFSTGYLFDV